MYLSQISLHGFKSFARKTTLHFAPGITAIVGPNGCGKSNIIDAVRWVLGEQRARLLRSEKMENVIFNGTSRRKPLGMAEVSLTIENTRNILPTEYSEVTITRRLYRSGVSEYLINGVQCRLKDILDLFMDTGMGPNAYSVIELSMVEELLSSNARERRPLFEEAAGTTRYKTRRTQTLRKLEQTEHDLERIADLITELERQARSLARQARKTRKWHQLKEELERLEQFLLRHEYETLLHQQELYQEKLSAQQLHLTALDAQLAQIEAQIQENHQQQITLEQTLSQHQKAFNTLLDELRQQETALQHVRVQKQQTTQTLERLTREKQQIDRQLEQAREKLQQVTQHISLLTPKVTEAQQQFQHTQQAREQAYQKEQHLRTQLRTLRKKENQLRTSLERLTHQLTRHENRKEYIEQTLATLTTQHQQLLQEKESRQAALTYLKKQVDEASQEVKRLEQELHVQVEKQQQLQQQAEQARQRYEQLLREHESIQAEIKLLQEWLNTTEELPDAVQSILHQIPDLSPQLLADYLQAPGEQRHLWTNALGPWLSALITSPEQALKALSLTEASGNLYLIAPEQTPAPPSPPSLPGLTPLTTAIESLKDRLPPALYTTLQHILSRTYLAPSREEALAAIQQYRTRYPDLRIITPTGEQFFADGRIKSKPGDPLTQLLDRRMAQQDRLQTLLKRQETLTQKVKEARLQWEHLQQAIQRDSLKQLQKALRDAEKYQHQAEQTLLKAQQELQHTERQLQHVHQQLQQLSEEQKHHAQQIANLLPHIQTLQDEADALRKKRIQIEETLQTAEEHSRQFAEQYAEYRVTYVERQNQLTTAQNEQKRLKQTIASLTKQRNKYANEYAEATARLSLLEQDMAARETQVQTLLEQREQLEKTLAHAQEQVLNIRNVLQELESTYRKHHRSREQHLEHIQDLKAQLTAIQTRMEALLEHLRTITPYTQLNELPPLPDSFQADQARKHIQHLKNRIQQLGAVNELAIDSHREVKERLAFVKTQYEDLVQASQSLKQTIREINRTASRQFTETFEAIRAHFKHLFDTLFEGKGKADLKLTHPEDPLESPIEIIAQPPGKRPVALTQLSGGEKTLTAIALLFAIYLVKPSPFCILDEVDAPLDDANIQRFMRLIRSFTRNTQFILVTHNKRTMEAADRLYGITMPEEGISTVVQVDFHALTEQEMAD